ENGIGFWSEFKRLGGVNALGYPVSRRFALDGFIVQATQKVIMQWRPDVSPPQVYFVNVFDKLHDQGKDSVLQQTYQIPAQLDPSFDAGKTADQSQAARLALLNADAAISGRYGTGPAAILYNGLPTSQVTNEGPFVSIRAQRVAIQHWTSANPAAGIKPGDVSVVNGGDIAKSLGLVPSDAQVTETSSGTPQATPTPVATATPIFTATPVATATPTFPFRSKGVTDPPVDCNNDLTHSSIPCVQVAANSNQQFIKGRVMDAQGNHLLFVPIRAVITGGASATQVVQTEGDGTFTFWIGGGPPGSNTISGSNCPGFQLQYQIAVTDTNGATVSDTRTINYDGNCNSDGEFHFDFVKTR
ncbi:MAG: hypothetical protein JOZ39_02125, partial [Chloroflexi bacterium]|nr:hypothetical protein [Chloroflexota bacterium]